MPALIGQIAAIQTAENGAFNCYKWPCEDDISAIFKARKDRSCRSMTDAGRGRKRNKSAALIFSLQ